MPNESGIVIHVNVSTVGRFEDGVGVFGGRGSVFLDGPHFPVPNVVVCGSEEHVFLIVVSGIVFETVVGFTRDKVPILVRRCLENHFGLEVGRLGDVRDDRSHYWSRQRDTEKKIVVRDLYKNAQARFLTLLGGVL